MTRLICHRSAIACLGALLLLQAPAVAADSLPSLRPELIPADVPVAALGQSAGLDASIPYHPSLTASVITKAGPPPLPAPDQLGALHYPLAVPALGLDPWGWRFSESRGRWRMHTGLDLMAPRGTPVLAALSGRVHLVQWTDGYGLTLVIDHGDGRRTLYAHLDAVGVRPGQSVTAGEPVAVVGMTGRTSGPHLHFELRFEEGGRWLARDPGPLLPAAQIRPLLASEREQLAQQPAAGFDLPGLPQAPPDLPPLLAGDLP